MVTSIILLSGLSALPLGACALSVFDAYLPNLTDMAPAVLASSIAPKAPFLLTFSSSYTVYLPIILGSGSSPVSAAFFPVGPGSTDVIPHQLIRTSDDRLYIFVSQPYSSTIRVYWTTPGLPNTPAAFTGSAQATESGIPISLDAAYDGGNVIHILVNTRNTGLLRDYPFDLTTNTFKPALTLTSDSHKITGTYPGTCGVSSMVDKDGRLHVAYWSSSNRIIHRAYTYSNSTNTLTLVSGPFTVDTGGSANHPVIAVSPLDNSLTVVWVSEATSPAKILARTRASTGTWGSVETVSTSSVWTSTNAGINIDQGPSLVIDANGTKHLAYIENWAITQPYDYGRIHYAVNDGSGWTDQALSFYTHDPALALNSAGQLYIIGHGYPLNPSCKSEDDMCTIKKNSDGTWGTPQLLAAHPNSTHSFDTSPSVKWSVMGFHRPETIEFLFCSTPYESPTVYYARLGG
jgi:hypothetical protein